MDFKSKPITASEPVILSISNYQEMDRLDIRHYRLPEGDGKEMYPTTKGVNVPVTLALDVVTKLLAILDGPQDAKANGRAEVQLIKWNAVWAGWHEYKGKLYFDVRNFWKPDGKPWTPTSKGISIPASCVQAFRQELEAVKVVLQTVGMAEPIRVDLGAAAVSSTSFAGLELS